MGQGLAVVRTIAGALLALLIAACTTVPTAELRAFRESVQTANAAAMPILDEASRTERRIAADLAARQGAAAFNPADAAYFSDLGDAPGTMLLRQGHKVLDALSEVLLGLATGTGTAADVGALESLATQVTELLALVASVSAPPAAAAFGLVKPALEELSRELSRKEARRVIALVEEKALVEKLTKALIDATPPLFNVLIRDADRLANTPATRNNVTIQALADRIVRTRNVLGNYVVLLRSVNGAWAEAAQAAKSSTSLNSVALAERIAELRSAALLTRQAYAALASGH